MINTLSGFKIYTNASTVGQDVFSNPRQEKTARNDLVSFPKHSPTSRRSSLEDAEATNPEQLRERIQAQEASLYTATGTLRSRAPIQPFEASMTSLEFHTKASRFIEQDNHASQHLFDESVTQIHHNQKNPLQTVVHAASWNATDMTGRQPNVTTTMTTQTLPNSTIMATHMEKVTAFYTHVRGETGLAPVSWRSGISFSV